MAQGLRSRGPIVDSDPEIESGEDNDDDAQMDTEEDKQLPGTSENSVASRRKRGNVWQSVAKEGDLATSLANVHTTESSTAPGFVDLDNPSTSAQEASRLPTTVRGRGRARGRRAARRAIRGGPRGGSRGVQSNASSSAVTSSSAIASTSQAMESGIPDETQASTAPVVQTDTAPAKDVAEIGAGDNVVVEGTGKHGQKRKNILKPKPKRRADQERKHYFSRFPDLNSEIEDGDSVDVAARKAAFQLQEKWNPWTITQIVSHLGNVEARKLLQLTKTIQSSGGMLTKDGSTKRTLGGVFITMFKSDAEAKLGKDFVKRLFAFPDGAPAKPKDLKKKQKAVRKRAERKATLAARMTGQQGSQDMEVLVAQSSASTSSVVEAPSLEPSLSTEAPMDLAVDDAPSVSVEVSPTGIVGLP